MEPADPRLPHPNRQEFKDPLDSADFSRTDWYEQLSPNDRSNLEVFMQELEIEGAWASASGFVKHIPEAVFLKPEILSRLKKYLLLSLRREHPDYAGEITALFMCVGDEARKQLIKDPEIKAAAKSCILRDIKEGNPSRHLLADECDIPLDDDIRKAVFTDVAARLVEDRYTPDRSEFDSWGISPEEIAQSKEIRDAAVGGVVYMMTTENLADKDVLRRGRLLVQFFGLDQEVMHEAAVSILVRLCQQNSWHRAMRLATELGKEFGLSDYDIQSPEVQEAIKSSTAKAIIEESSIGKEMIERLKLSRATAQEVYEEVILGQLAAEKYGIILRVIKDFNLDPTKFRTPEIKKEVSEKIENILDISNSLPLIYFFEIDVTETLPQALKCISRKVRYGDFDSADQLITTYGIPSELLQTPEMLKNAKEGLPKKLFDDIKSHPLRKTINKISLVAEKFGLTGRDVEESAREVLVRSFMEDAHLEGRISTEYELPEEIDALYPEYIKKLAVAFELTTQQELKAFIDENNTYVYIVEDGTGPLLTKKDIPTIKGFHITLLEAELLLQRGASLEALSDPAYRFTALKNLEDQYDRQGVSRFHTDWADEQNVTGPFEKGAKLFGHERMFAFIDRPGLTRHDALHAFDEAGTLWRISELDPEQFYGNILFQVMKDDAQYEEGTAHHKLNAIATTFPYVETVLDKARQYSDIRLLGELAETFSSRKDIFASWKNLKRFHELSQLLERAEMLDELKAFRSKGKQKLSDFVETLAFHPNSSVDMHAAGLFLQNPAEFFDLHDNHAPEIHNRKKPSNYTEIPNLDLTAEELRDALVEGPLDRLQAFSPLAIEYSFGGDVNIPESPQAVRELFQKAIGSRREKIAGEAKNPGKIFSELQKLLKQHNIDALAWLLGQVELSNDAQLQQNLTDLLFHKDAGFKRPKGKGTTGVTYLAKINRKSDPDGVLAGNDTVCCMPFGSGKNNVYMANPDTSLFTIQIKRADGTTKTIAQSVLTKDIDIGRAIPEVLQELNETGKHIDQVIPADILNEKQSIIACDNIEINPNYNDPEVLERISQIYKDFFTVYLSGQKEAYDSRVVIGMGYTDLRVPMDRVANSFAPKAPVGYSDKTGEQVYVIDTKKESPKLRKKIVENVVSKEPPTLVNGVGPLTFEDTLPVAYLEGKAYKDNETLMTYLHNMENGLIAKDINNTAKGRPNLSLKYVDPDGRMRGYLFAYEGRAGLEEAAPVIYISDLASDRESRLAGGKLIRAFIEKYRTEYLDKANPLPILVEARESTSYKIIQRQVTSVGRELGIRFEIKELSQELKGQDVMRRLIISPRV